MQDLNKIDLAFIWMGDCNIFSCLFSSRVEDVVTFYLKSNKFLEAAT